MEQQEKLRKATEMYISQVAPQAYVVYVRTSASDDPDALTPLFPEEGERLFKNQRWVTVRRGKACFPLFKCHHTLDLLDILIDEWQDLNNADDAALIEDRPPIFVLDGFGLNDNMGTSYDSWKDIDEQLKGK